MSKMIELKLLSKTVFLFSMLLTIGCSMADSSRTIENISINNSSAKTFSIEPFISQCRFVKLGDATDISATITEKVQSFYFENNKFWFFCREGGDNDIVSIKVFDKEGKVERIFSLEQGGPSGFKALVDFWTNGRDMELLDVWGQAIWRATYPSSAFEKFELPGMFSKFYKINGDTYVFDNDNSPSDLVADYNLSLYSMNDNRLWSNADPIMPFHLGVGIQGRRLSKNSGKHEILYFPPVGTTIYEITPDTIVPVMKLDFSKGEFNKDENIGMDAGSYLSLRSSQRFITSLDQFHCHGNFCMAQFRYEKAFYWALFDRKTGRSKCVKPDFPFVQEYLLSYRPLLINDDREVAFFVDPADLLAYFQQHPVFKDKSPALNALSKSLRVDDNPIVMWVPLQIFQDLLSS